MAMAFACGYAGAKISSARRRAHKTVEVGVAAVVAIQEVAIGGITTTRTRVAEVEEEEIEAEGGDVAGRGDLLTATATWAALGLNLQATPQTARAGR